MKKQLGIALVAGFIIVQSCSHATQKSVDNKLAQGPEIRSQSELRALTSHTIESAPDLSADQKSELIALRDETQAKTASYQERSLKLRNLLVQEVIAKPYNRAEVDYIKGQIKSLENEKVATIFESVEKANRILGNQAQNHSQAFDEVVSERGTLNSAVGG